ncbi:ASCH domain-containing protein [Chryseobacterium sp.]|uniref:ASCH domain-containing protein n=1 Tax=Chryseobacterium sp. TaxID=1871047 RepID=UPI0025C32E17|nr:ASCH domain-containing protein [Chryseobacterium sp.]MBV8325104.1 ASCH domain-containing protein [Chryseobacterium sp.]
MSQISIYWKQFTDSLQGSSAIPDLAGSFHFGGKEDASSIAELVVSGIKIATGSLLWGYEHTAMPAVGEYNIITDSDDQPVCIIETIGISVIPFDKVEDQFAFDCGEGDRTLQAWREMYWKYIRSECCRIGKKPVPDAPMICEYFKLVYKEPLYH